MCLASFNYSAYAAGYPPASLHPTHVQTCFPCDHSSLNVHFWLDSCTSWKLGQISDLASSVFSSVSDTLGILRSPSFWRRLVRPSAWALSRSLWPAWSDSVGLAAAHFLVGLSLDSCLRRGHLWAARWPIQALLWSIKMQPQQLLRTREVFSCLFWYQNFIIKKPAFKINN